MSDPLDDYLRTGGSDFSFAPTGTAGAGQTYDSFGNVVSIGSPAASSADPTGLAQAQLDALSSSGNQTKSFLDTVKSVFGGTSDYGQLGQLAAFGGLGALLNKFAGQQAQQPVGYQGGIPQYTASRTQYNTGLSADTARLKQAINDSLAQGFTMDQVRQGALQKFGISPEQISEAVASPVGAYRRPGQGGITYFSPIQYTASGQDLARPTAGQVVGGTTSGAANQGGTSGTAPAAQAAPRYSDDQVAAAIRTSLQQGYKAEDILARAAQMGATADQISRARDVLQQTGYLSGIATLPGTQADTGGSVGDQVERRTALSASTRSPADLRRLEAEAPTPRNYQTVGTVGGVPLRVGVGPASSDYVFIGGRPISNLDVLQDVAKTFGFSQDEVMQATRLISERSPYKALGANLYSPIFNAIRDSLQTGYTMDQVYEGAQKNFGLSKADVDAAMRYNNVDPNRPSVLSGEEVMRMARENLPGAASGGYMPGGIAMLAKGRYLKGNGDGVSDSIPARFDGSGQEARLADGEFVIPARVVSEIGNGSSDAGARKLYAMLDRVEARAKKSKRGKPSGADRELNKLA